MEKAELFDKVSSRRLYQRVADKIRDLVIAGKLQAGDRLPSEAGLCEQFGVSRTVVREATKSLVARGLLESAPGKGTFVSAMTPGEMSAARSEAGIRPPQKSSIQKPNSSLSWRTRTPKTHQVETTRRVGVVVASCDAEPLPSERPCAPAHYPVRPCIRPWRVAVR